MILLFSTLPILAGPPVTPQGPVLILILPAHSIHPLFSPADVTLVPLPLPIPVTVSSPVHSPSSNYLLRHPLLPHLFLSIPTPCVVIVISLLISSIHRTIVIITIIIIVNLLSFFSFFLPLSLPFSYHIPTTITYYY